MYKLAALAREGHLTNLRTLWLSACDQEDLPNLIGPSQLSDDGLIHLASLTSIKSLCLSCNCNITCVGLSFLVSPTPEHLLGPVLPLAPCCNLLPTSLCH